MSLPEFKEEDERDPHGECAQEIKQLKKDIVFLLDVLAHAHTRMRDAYLYVKTEKDIVAFLDNCRDVYNLFTHEMDKTVEERGEIWKSFRK